MPKEPMYEQRDLVAPATEPTDIARLQDGGGGGTSTVTVNGTEMELETLQFIGNVLVHPDAESKTLQVEYLDQLDGSATDPEAPVGWGNWTTGDLRWLPGVTVAPYRTLACNGQYARSDSYPDVLSSPHVTLTEDNINVLSYGGSPAADGWYSKGGDPCLYWSTYANDSTYQRPPHAAYGGDDVPLIINYGGNAWLDTELIIKFPGLLLFSGFGMPSTTNTYNFASFNGTNLYGGIDSWDLYGMVNPDTLPTAQQPGDFELIDEFTNRYVTPANSMFVVPGGKEYYGMKLKIKKVCVTVNSWDPDTSPWPSTAANTTQVWMYGLQLRKSEIFQVPNLPTAENGVNGIWAIKAMDGEVGVR